MKPDKTHEQYDEFKPVWKLCRDASIGQRAVHKAGTDYLPKLSGQTIEEYSAYRDRAQFFGATGRTVEGMVGLVFRKQASVTVPDTFQTYLDDVNMAGDSLDALSRSAVEEAIKVGRLGVLVDYPPAPEVEASLTIEDSRQLGQRPYMALYKAEAIINWRYGYVNNATRLIQVFLNEVYDDGGTDAVQIRELSLIEGVYTQTIWRKGEGKDGWEAVEMFEPKINGAPIGEIPFFIVSSKEGSRDVQEPPIESLANVNLGHYRNSADLENGAHISGLPTAYVTGFEARYDDKGEMIPEKIHLGSNTVLCLPAGSEAGFMQCGSEGFATLEKAMDRKEQQMAALGARMLAPEKRQSESAESHEIKRGGENSVLATLAGSVDGVLTNALRFMAEWVGMDAKDVSFALNKDYMPVSMDANMLRELVGSWQQGVISYDTLVGTLKRGEIVPETLNAEDEREKIEQEAPALGMAGRDNANDQ